jgi:N6-L-threonylcarbamoyladenine synthase
MADRRFHRVLAIETSCDDTSVAIVGDDGWVFGLASASQDQAHQPFGGVVPEIASRNHTHILLPLIDRVLSESRTSWNDVDGIVVTHAPGLIGSLLVGVVTAKTLALVKGKPFIGVNHLEGHLLAPFLRDTQYAPPADFSYPYIGLAISGGHTSLYRINGLGEYEVLGHTVDDAAGEAFDKFAKAAGLGFPGGVKVDKLSQGADPDAYKLPRAMIHEDNLLFSFSGLKTHAQNIMSPMTPEELQENLPDLCASFQEAIVDALIDRLQKAVVQEGLNRAVLTGGVSANSRLRERTHEWASKAGVQLVVPPIRYCTDNAAMIGYAGIQRLNRGEVSQQSLGPLPKAPLGTRREGVRPHGPRR